MSRPLGLALGWALDQAVGDPGRWHPVAGFGSVATALEQRTYAARRADGVAHIALLVAATAGLGAVAERTARRSDVVHTLVTAAATWAVLGGRSLTREAATIDDQLRRGDLDAARVQVRNLVGRDTTRLDGDEVARACIESLAENTSDAVVAPLLWGGLLGVPGLLGYRAVNTLDAMVGHRNDRYREFGWAAARLDDGANWVPARVAAATALAGAGSRERALRGWAAIRRDAPAHPSPNGGVVEAAFAGVLGVRLGGSNAYDGLVEDRGTLGDGPVASVQDIAPATRLARRVGAGSLAVAVIWSVRGRPRRRR
ncbi:adenosylcobinamide-phosphate synthase CbiB [Terrabacter sp. Root181]|uniref:adenosylcobinamide-phosphate synthase CbiB n=1 Tax=Terrabacter sp. Root181 TaxID=1736484 RepID=UPI0006FF1340|nr:adenosylcobinamide-phosphate synthase CbiB [Terrabacter sp. Root181]KRB46045.1 cobalamin biosynthesis protein CobD [Terrabacter sp. Root181]